MIPAVTEAGENGRTSIIHAQKTSIGNPATTDRLLRTVDFSVLVMNLLSYEAILPMPEKN
jgi:hypothetical protein